MIDDGTARLAAALAEPLERSAAGQRLAAHVGATALIILVHDPDVDAFLPAPGFSQTLPGGAAWRDFLRQARRPGVHHGHVGYPAADQLAPAVSHTSPGAMLIFVGAACDAARVESIGTLAPLLASTLRAEHAALMARGELKVAQAHARQTEALARALDAARAEVERAVMELERQARDLDDARARAEEATEAKDEFLAMLGHELRNPLSPILTALQLMRLKKQSSREQDVIERQVGSLMRLVDDLLDVSRITRGKIELRKERVELSDIAARAIEMASPVLEKKRQVLAVDIPARGLVVDADPSRLAQVLANLLTNAAKYSDNDTEIVFAAEGVGHHVRCRVKDQGIGIGPEMLHRVFDAFVQHRQALDRSQGGLGLGLTIVRSLVQMHGGTVRVHSQGEGKGSEFIVELPRAIGDAPQIPGSRPEASVTTPRRMSRSLERVLVVDDNDDAAMLISEALEALGYTVRTAPDGPAALRIAEEFAPQVALLDIGLPVMDGYELAQRLRDMRNLLTLRLVAVTGYGQGEDKRRSREVGFDAHLVKPIALDELQHVFDSFRRPPVPGSRGAHQ